MNLLSELELAKANFRDAVDRNGGKHGVWTAEEYIQSWVDELSVPDLIHRLNRESNVMDAWNKRQQ